MKNKKLSKGFEKIKTPKLNNKNYKKMKDPFKKPLDLMKGIEYPDIDSKLKNSGFGSGFNSSFGGLPKNKNLNKPKEKKFDFFGGFDTKF